MKPILRFQSSERKYNQRHKCFICLSKICNAMRASLTGSRIGTGLGAGTSKVGIAVLEAGYVFLLFYLLGDYHLFLPILGTVFRLVMPPMLVVV